MRYVFSLLALGLLLTSSQGCLRRTELPLEAMKKEIPYGTIPLPRETPYSLPEKSIVPLEKGDCVSYDGIFLTQSILDSTTAKIKELRGYNKLLHSYMDVQCEKCSSKVYEIMGLQIEEDYKHNKKVLRNAVIASFVAGLIVPSALIVLIP